ncbi:MAG: hypothetical protein ACTHU0_03240 [Kofleriaceae bacterium]
MAKRAAASPADGAPKKVGELREFLFQFNDDLVDVHLGDAGRMYVFEDGAYWICH